MSERILVVDDDPVQRRLIESMVRKFGYEAVVAEGGDQAARILNGDAAAPIDCVILDLVMPDLDGLGLLGRLRGEGNAVPVIVQTAHGGIDNVISAMRAGAADFVVKPVGVERLQVSLRNALNPSALKGELQRIRHSREGRLTFSDIGLAPNTMAAMPRSNSSHQFLARACSIGRGAGVTEDVDMAITSWKRAAEWTAPGALGRLGRNRKWLEAG